VLLPGPPVNIITHCSLGPQADHPVYVFLCDFFTSRLYFACVRVVWDSVGPSLRLSCRAERPPSSPSPVAVGTGFKPRQEAVPTAPRPLHLPLGQSRRAGAELRRAIYPTSSLTELRSPSLSWRWRPRAPLVRAHRPELSTPS
jgi:hypothetical protein